MLKIAITGGLATGKSTASAYIKEKGYCVIDADYGARQVVKPGSLGLKLICEKLGKKYIDAKGKLDREKLGQDIFNQSAKRQKLDALLHPLIFDWIDQEVAKCQDSVVFIDMPLLYETGYQKKVDEVWLVYCPYDQQVERLMARNQLSRQEADQRIASQWPIEDKKNLATVTIYNDKDLDYLHQQIDRLLLLV